LTLGSNTSPSVIKQVTSSTRGRGLVLQVLWYVFWWYVEVGEDRGSQVVQFSTCC